MEIHARSKSQSLFLLTLSQCAFTGNEYQREREPGEMAQKLEPALCPTSKEWVATGLPSDLLAKVKRVDSDSSTYCLSKGMTYVGNGKQAFLLLGQTLEREIPGFFLFLLPHVKLHRKSRKYVCLPTLSEL